MKTIIGSSKWKPWRRPIALLGTGAITATLFIAVNFVCDLDLLRNLFDPSLETTPKVQAWNALLYM